MKLSNFKRIVKENFSEDERPLIEKMGYSINIFAEEVFNLFSKNITIEDNMLQEIKTVEVQVLDSNNMIPKNTLQFKNNLRNALKGVLVINVENLTNSSIFPTGPVQVFFTEANNIVTVNRITGLQNEYKYRIKLLTIGG